MSEFYNKMVRLGSFPKGERDQPYQEYYYKGEWVTCQREIRNRAKLMGFNPQAGERVVEIGCCTGGFMQFAWLNGARDVTGFEYDPDYVSLARELNQINGTEINYVHGNALSDADLAPIYNGKARIDHLLIMSMGKHIGERRLFNIVDRLKPRKVYIETNAVNAKNPYPHIDAVKRRGGSVVCRTHDRNERVVYVINFN